MILASTRVFKLSISNPSLKLPGDYRIQRIFFSGTNGFQVDDLVPLVPRNFHHPAFESNFWANSSDLSRGHLKKGGLVKESHQNPLNSGLGIILICPELNGWMFKSRWMNETSWQLAIFFYAGSEGLRFYGNGQAPGHQVWWGLVVYMISSSSKDSRLPRSLAIVLVKHLKWNRAAFVFFLQLVFFPDRRLPLVTMMSTWEMFQWCHFPCLVDLINLHCRHWIWNHLPMVLGPWPPILFIGENSSLKV